ncbi:carbohydrate sulfotransferase 11-like [Bolinopsis microptera]|uniref:carbohydrate sulfotransferase 11-like n=1 Tax=Bolinopsis microptera TaxID=2820187 RepID=UPI00307A5740
MGWCPVFKAASTNWKQFFCKIYLPHVYDEWRIKTDQDPYCPLGKLMTDHLVRNLEIKLKQQSKVQPEFDGLGALSDLRSGLADSVKFLTVRHPYERLVSLYTNKFKDCVSRMYSNPDGAMVKIFQLYRKTEQKFSPEEKARLIEEARSECLKPLDERQIDKDNPYMNPMGATFKEVMQLIISNFMNRVGPDFHWIQVTKSCDVCSKKYQVIEKFETLERDHYFLLKILGEEARYPDIAGSHDNPSVKGRNPHELVFHYFSQLDENMLWDLQAVYKDDFNAFGYNPHFRVRKNPYNIQKSQCGTRVLGIVVGIFSIIYVLLL